MKDQLIQFVWNGVDHLFAKRSIKSPKESLLNTAANLFTTGESYYYIIDFVDPSSFNYFSPNTAKLLNIDPDTYNVERMMQLIHPEDIEHAHQCEKCIFDFIENKIPLEKIFDYKFNYQIRVKINGVYKMVLHQALTLSTDGFGRLSKVLSVDTIIEHITSVNRKKLSIIGLRGAPSYYSLEPDLKTYLDHPSQHIMFTPRELEVIHYFMDGLTAKEVATRMSLSEETIRSHRKNCLRKANCSNMTSLVAFCIKSGWI